MTTSTLYRHRRLQVFAVLVATIFFAAVPTTTDITTTATIDKNNNKWPPLILGVGRGTTATHLMYEATCHDGFKSIHWARYCFSPTKVGSKDVPEACRVHRLFTKHFLDLRDCAHAACLELDLQEWATTARELLEAVLTNPYLEALHDTPYPHFMPYILKRLKELGRPTVILLSERGDSVEWAAKRVGKAIDIPGPSLCKEFLTDADNNPPTALGGGAFDVLGCVDRGLERAKEASLALPKAGDLIVTYGTLLSQDVANAKRVIQPPFIKYQNDMRSIAAYSLDAFVRAGRTTGAGLVQEIHDNVKQWPHTGRDPMVTESGANVSSIPHWP